MGNSHTRQTIHSLICAYSEERIIDTTTPIGDNDDGKTETYYHFSNGATLLLVTNSPYVYTKEWPTILVETIFHRNLSTIDAIVLGQFNNYKRRGAQTTFQKQMLKFTEQIEAIDYVNVRAPTLKDVLKVYDGPIVAVSMFAQYGDNWFRTSYRESLSFQQKNRSNVFLLNGRAHIAHLGECGSDGGREIGKCLMQGDTSPYGRDPVNMHRCTGPKGGHPDLLGWDVIEALYKALS